MLPGFTTRSVDAGDLSINVAVAGDGPPVLLLHGYPQTHVMWHRVAPDVYLTSTLEDWCGTPGALSADAVAEYRRCFDEATIHATCEDYRAGATIDLVHDRADEHEPVQCPTLVLWSAGGIGAAYDVAAIWREHAPRMRGRPLDCGHFIAEERPEETVAELRAFLSGAH